MKKRIWISGHKGMVGSSLLRIFKKSKYKILTVNKNKIDLRNQIEVDNWIKKNKPDVIIIAAAKVGGIKHNSTFPADFIYDNLTISSNIIHAAYKYKTRKLINLGSACIYPKFCKQPIKEEYLLTGELEKTNEAYAIAKIAALKMCEYFNKQHKTKFISLQPTNLYGYNDNFNLQTSHVLPALIRKFHEAKINKKNHVEIWGTGKATREFMFVDDLASAIKFLIGKKLNFNVINVGSGEEISIKKLAEKIKKIIGYKGKIIFNKNYPDGTPRRIVSSKRINQMGWKSKIKLNEGIKLTYKYFLENYSSFRY
jgi:GDP-L-fucose synthase